MQNETNATKLTRTQKAVLIFWINGTPSGIQSNHYINAKRALIKKGLLSCTCTENQVKTELTEAGRNAGKSLV